jgi:cardiolipin synthase A/B
MLTVLAVGGTVALWGVALLFAVRAVRTARTPQGSVGWVVFLISAPYFAVPAYLFLGHSRYPGYVAARRQSEQTMATLDGQRHACGTAVREWRYPGVTRAAAFERLANLPIVRGNTFELLVDGKAAFDAMFGTMEGARSYVLVGLYILRDDRLGRALKDRLLCLARRGVHVRVLYDPVGSAGLAKSYLDDMRDGGVDIRRFHSVRSMLNRFQVNFRNHRKIVIVDGKTGFVGGLNVGDEYMGWDPEIGHWRDTHLKLDGPAVSQLQLVFMEDWHWSGGGTLPLFWKVEPQADGIEVVILAPGPADRVETGSLYFCNAIGAATERLWIASPYFVPDIDTLSALKLAALRGVDVRILVPEQRDHLIVWLAAFAYFDEVREAGVSIWRYQDGFMHQKALVVDNSFASVGTLNLDIRSCRLNFEATALMFDETAAREVAAMLEADFAKSHRYDTPLAQAGWRMRFGAPIARLFAPLL